MNKERLMKVLLSPVVSEKSTVMAETNKQFAFNVVSNANKGEVKASVELLFDVKVDSVKVVNIKGKQKRFGARLGCRKDRRKAYVRLKDGFDIDFAGAQ